jgi:hypothetical protein
MDIDRIYWTSQILPVGAHPENPVNVLERTLGLKL